MVSNNTTVTDVRIAKYMEVIERLQQGHYNLEIPLLAAGDDDDDFNRLGQALQSLAQTLEIRYRQMQKLNDLTSHINAGLLLDEILEIVYRDFREVIPYNRIGFSLIEDNGQMVRSYWARSDRPLFLSKGYTASLAGSSLAAVVHSGHPRIINNLPTYLQRKPTSHSTYLIVQEGMCSSLTCPLITNGMPVGFMFFSSVEPNTYSMSHVELFKGIASQLSVILEKGRLVSELAAQKEAIEQQNDELRRLNELKNSFLGIAAHDLRNPLSNIQLITHLLTEENSDLSEVESKSLLNDINKQTGHMLSLLNELLDVTQIEAGKLNLQLKEIDLGLFLAETIRRQAMIAGPKGTRIHLEVEPGGEVLADPVQLRQVADNLISNAVKYSPPGSTVMVSVTRLDNGWRVNVQDEGPGITAEDRHLLFQDFARLSAKPTGGEKSIGLGLAISRRVVEAHGGKIGVDSEPGRGANFWFTLPDHRV
ncbi:MAG: GAF domain-containing sensor histidine kinase [Chloroflexota bacterium]